MIQNLTRPIAWLAIMLVVAFVAIPTTSSRAQNYGIDVINLIVGEPTGGGYDTYGRLLARHIQRHIPGQPTVVVRNMPGAGSVNAMNHLFMWRRVMAVHSALCSAA